MSDFVAVNARQVPYEIRNRFKAFCAEQEVTMSYALSVLMEKAVRERLDIEVEEIVNSHERKK